MVLPPEPTQSQILSKGVNRIFAFGKQDFQLGSRDAPEDLEMQRVFGHPLKHLLASRAFHQLFRLFPADALRLHDFSHTLRKRLQLQPDEKPAIGVDINLALAQPKGLPRPHIDLVLDLSPVIQKVKVVFVKIDFCRKPGVIFLLKKLLEGGIIDLQIIRALNEVDDHRLELFELRAAFVARDHPVINGLIVRIERVVGLDERVEQPRPFHLPKRAHIAHNLLGNLLLVWLETFIEDPLDDVGPVHRDEFLRIGGCDGLCDDVEAGLGLL